MKALIIEDDESVRSALERILKKEGVETYCTLDMEEAISLSASHKIELAFIDCLLPSSSGNDFAKSLRERFDENELKIVLMSGIFTDRQFMKDTVNETRANGFLKKPFTIEQVKELIPASSRESSSHGEGRRESVVETIPPRKALYQLFSRIKPSYRDKKKSIEALEEIHGFDLPFLYSLLVDSKSSGHLNIVNQQGQISGISISNGVIVAVDVPDKESFLGKLLIEGGFIHPDDLDTYVLNFPKRMGQSLIQNNLLSPHAFEIVLAEQMNIRLSKTVEDMGLKFNFVEAEVDLSYPNIDSTRFETFLHDWIAGKISKSWLRAHYMQWLDTPIGLGPGYDPKSQVLKMPLFLHLENIVQNTVKAKSLGDILDQKLYPEEAFYKALHYLFCKGMLVFKNNVEQDLAAAPVNTKLVKIMDQIKGKNSLELMSTLALLVGTNDQDHKTTYKVFMSFIGQEPNAEVDPAGHALHQNLRRIVNEAYKILQNTGAKTKLREEMAKNEIEGKLKASQEFDIGKDFLSKAMYPKALEVLSRVFKVDPSLHNIRIYLLWAKIGNLDRAANRQGFLREIEIEFAQIPLEQRYDALYIYVQGFLLKAKGDFVSAKKTFEKALTADSSFVPARRELALIDSRIKAEGGDLKNMVSSFFKRRSS